MCRFLLSAAAVCAHRLGFRSKKNKHFLRLRTHTEKRSSHRFSDNWKREQLPLPAASIQQAAVPAATDAAMRNLQNKSRIC